MPVKAVAKKDEKPAQAPEAQKTSPPRRALVATAPTPKAHHATLGETKCSDCAVGLLEQYATESLRNQRKLDPGNQQHHLRDDQEVALIRTRPLERARSL